MKTARVTIQVEDDEGVPFTLDMGAIAIDLPPGSNARQIRAEMDRVLRDALREFGADDRAPFTAPGHC